MDEILRLLNLHLSFGEIIAGLVLSVVCGGILGWERESHNKSAGLRTHMMVSLGSAAFLLMTLELEAQGLAMGNSPDPSRVIQGVITGIGFLGGGAIFRAGTSVHGLTTAAGIWVVGGIGACCGAGLYGLAILVTILAFFILKVFLWVELRFFANGDQEDTHDRHDVAKDRDQGD